MSTFLGLLSGGRPPARYETYRLSGLGQATTTKKKVAPKKAKGKGKKAAPRPKAATKTEIKVRVRGGLRHAPLDRHHNPFKRDSIRPGAMAKRETQRSDTWSCDWKAPYVQLCTMVGVTKKDGSPKTKLIKVKRKYKKDYNKEYHKHLKELGKPKFAKNEKDDLYSFRETAWQKAHPPKGRKKKAKASTKKAPAKKSTTKKSRAKASA